MKVDLEKRGWGVGGRRASMTPLTNYGLKLRRSSESKTFKQLFSLSSQNFMKFYKLKSVGRNKADLFKI